MATPEDDLSVSNPFVLGGRPSALAEQIAKKGDRGILNLLGSEFAPDYERTMGQDPAKAMLRSTDAMLAEVKEQTRYMRDTVEMLRQSNEMTAKQADVLRQAIREAAADTRSSLMGQVPPPPGADPGAIPTTGGRPGPAMGPGGVARPGTFETGGFPTPADREDPDLEAERRKQLEQRFYSAQTKPIETLRTEFFGNVARRISEYEPSDDLRYAARLEEMAGVEDGSAARALARRASLASGARNMAGNVAEKGVRGGLMQSLAGSGVARLAGTAALAYGAVNTGLDFAENQREENRAYQAATGDSNFGGFAFRGRQNLFGLSQRGRMGSENAQQLYGAVAALNVDEQTQAEALDFASDAFMRFGQSVGQSVRMIEDAIARGETNFSQLTESLEGVTQAAAAAGVNAETARQNFTNQLNTATQTFGSGPGAMQVAQIGAQFQTGLGQRFADNAAFNPLMSDLNVRSYGAAMGMEYGQVRSAVRQNDPDVIMGLSQSADALTNTALNTTIGGDAQQRIRASIEAKVAASPYASVDEMRRLARPQFDRILMQALDEERSANGGIDPMQMQQIARNYLNLDTSNPEEAELAVLNFLSGQGMQQQTAEVQQQDRERRENLGVSGVDVMGGSLDRQVQEATGVDNDVDAWFTSQTGGEFRDELLETYTGTIRATASRGGEAKRSGVVEDVISQAEAGQQFVVQTKDGRRVVSAADAIRHFSDQLQSGTAEYFGGSQAGETIAGAMGFEAGEAGTEGFTGASGTAARESDLGMTEEEARRQQAEDAGAGPTGTITVKAGPGLVGPQGQPLFEFLWNMDVAEANKQGVPAPSTASR